LIGHGRKHRVHPPELARAKVTLPTSHAASIGEKRQEPGLTFLWDRRLAARCRTGIAVAQASQGLIMHHTQPVAKEWTRTGARRRCHHRRDCPARRTLRCRGERNGAQRPLAAGKPFSTNSSSAITIFWDGVSPRPRVQLFFGQVPAELLERAESSVLFVASEPSILTPEPRSKTSAAKDHPMREADAAVH
jgi:hypothetical protein